MKVSCCYYNDNDDDDVTVDVYVIPILVLPSVKAKELKKLCPVI